MQDLVRRVSTSPSPTGTPSPIYRETISKPSDVHYRHRKQTGGAGQFADVKLSIHPNERGQGFTFGETVKGGVVPRNYIPAVEAGAREAMDKARSGFQVIDVGVTLTDGQHHSVDSSEFAFRTAGKWESGRRSSQASAVLMQPVFRARFHIPSVYSGSLVQIVSAFKGQVLGFDRDEPPRDGIFSGPSFPAARSTNWRVRCARRRRASALISKTFDHFEELYGKEADAIVKTHGTQRAEH